MKRVPYVFSAAIVGALMAYGNTPAFAATPDAVWHMDDTGTVMTDASGNGNDGTLTSVTTGAAGLSGLAYRFATSPSLVSVPNSPTLNPGANPFSVTVHLRFSRLPSTEVGDYDVIRKGLAGAAGGDWKMEIRQDGRPYCTFRGSTHRVTLSKSMNLADGTWHKVTCAKTDTGVRLVVDGKMYNKAGLTGSISNTSQVFIGAKNVPGGDQYTGLLDEVTITST